MRWAWRHRTLSRGNRECSQPRLYVWRSQHSPFCGVSAAHRTGKSKERAVYEGIESSLDEKRKYREEMGTLGYAGGEYTNYRRGAGRDKFDEENAAKKKKPASDYARVEDIVVMSQAKRMATP